MQTRLPLGALALTACLLAAPTIASAQAIPFTEITKALNSVHQFSEVALSPDGRYIAYVESAGDRSTVRLGVAATPATAMAMPCITPHCDTNDIAWSPDSARLAYVATDEKGQGQIAVSAVRERGGQIIAHLTHAKGPVSTPRWSPDGKWIAFLYSPGAPKAPSPLNPSTPDAGVVGGKIYEQRLAVIPSDGGAIKLLGPADLNVYEYDWAPDSKKFAATAAHGNGDANWWIAELYTIDAASGAATSIHKPELQIASPRWSGDGKRIAYIGGIMSDEAITGGDVYVVPAAGGEATNVTPELKASVTTIAWNGSPNRILATELAGDRMLIASIDADAKM